MEIKAATRPHHTLALAALVVASTLSLTAFGLPRAAGGTPVAAAASCQKFFESNIQGIAADLTFGPQNRIWISEGGLLSVQKVRGISPSGGADVTFPLNVSGMDDPQGIAVGGDGRLWIAGGSAGNAIAALDPGTGAVVSFPLSGAPMRIAPGSDGNLWVTLRSANAIAKVGTAGALLATFPLATGAAPFDITAATDGALWFTESGAAKIGRLTTGGALTEFAVGANPFDIAANGTDLWFTERAASKVGHLTVLGIDLFEVATPTAAADPWGLTVGSDNGVWFTEHGAAMVGRLDPVTRTINETLITTSTSPPTEMLAIPDGTVWFAVEASHIEHFKPNAGGTVGPLPPTVALTAGTPSQTLPGGGTVFSTSTTFTIGPTDLNQCIDSISYRITAAGAAPGAFTTVAASTVSFTLPNGTSTVEFFATGPGGQGLTQTATLVVDQSKFVSDTTPPVITTPGNIAVPSTSVSGAIVTFNVTAFDAKDGTTAVTCTPPSGSLFPIGTTPVICTSSDSTGNRATASFNVTVTAAPPVVTVPASFTIAATGATTPVMFAASAVSPWGGPLAVTCTPPGTTQPTPASFTYAFTSNATTTVTCVSAKDGLGQQGTASFTVTPITPPTLTLPGNITVPATGPTTPVTFTATGTAFGGGSAPVTCTPPSGSGFVVGTTLVTCVANDRGVTSTGSFTVTVNAPPPTLTLPADITRVVTGTSAVVTFTVTASSVVDGSLVPTCTPSSGSTFPLGTTVVSCSVTDARGQLTTETFKITIANTQPSTLTITSKPIQPQGNTVVSAKLLGPGGAPIVGRTVTFTAGPATATGVTNASGVASATLRLRPGLYTLNARFAGDASFSASSATSPLLVRPGAKGDDKGDRGDKDKGDKGDRGGDGGDKRDRGREGRD